MRMLVVLFMMFALAGIVAAQCEEKRTTLDISQCLGTALKRADTELNRSYQQALKNLNMADGERLRIAQRAWAAYRDAQCKAEFELWDGGTGGQIALPQCMLKLTKRRTTEIKETYGGEKP